MDIRTPPAAVPVYDVKATFPDSQTVTWCTVVRDLDFAVAQMDDAMENGAIGAEVLLDGVCIEFTMVASVELAPPLTSQAIGLLRAAV